MESLAEQDENWLIERMPDATDDQIATFIEWVGKILNDDNETLDSARKKAFGWLSAN